MRDYEEVKFSEAYDFAHYAWALFFNIMDGDSEVGELLSHINVRSKAFVSRRQKPHRDTLLHIFLQRLYWMSYVRDFEHHRNDMLDLVVQEYEAILKFNVVPFRVFKLPPESSTDYEGLALHRVAYLRRKLPVGRIAQDTFQLLFRDRLFLLAFNQAIAGQCLDAPRVRRVVLPSWLRRGVFYRDNGRCVACAKDLSGASILGDAVHFDHIVPIAAGGSNDPTNFQLLCDKCNHQKAIATFTSERYPVFWALS